MAPFSDEQNKWPYHSLDHIGVRLVPLMVQADQALGENRYQQWIQQADFSATNNKRRGAVTEALRDIGLLSVSVNK